MPVYKDKHGWYARINYTDAFGNYKSKKSKRYETKREAQEAEHVLALNVHSFSSSSCTFSSIYEEFRVWKKENVKTSTWITYPSMWNHCSSIANLKIKDLTVPRFKAFKEELTSKGLSVGRKNKIVKFVGQLISYASSMYDVTNNVVDRVGGFKEPDKVRTRKVDFYTYEEFKKFIDCVDEPVYHALFMTLYYQGCRIGEANALTWNDIDFANHSMVINKTVNTKIKGVPYLITSTKKTASDRVLPLDAEVEKELQDLKSHFMEYKNFEPSWFVFGGSRPLGESYVHVIKDQASDKAELKHIRVHDFRHSCASFLINIGCQPMVVQKYLGHASLKITMDTYSHMYPSQLSEASKLISQFKSSN